MPQRPLVTLTTDFGTTGTWIAQMKGILLALAPDVTIVDLTHGVPPHDVETGSYLLDTAVNAFPRGTIHVAVVDPGVGTTRRPVVVRTESSLLVGPDNGLFTRVLRRHPARGAWVLEASHYRAQEISATFEGRDVFAPAAAWLSRGTDPSRFGPPVENLVELPPPARPPSPPAGFDTRVIHVDDFGNVVLDVTAVDLAGWIDPSSGRVRLRATTPGGAVVDEVRRTFGDGPRGIPFLLVNSSGYLEIAMREESAARHLSVSPRDPVRLDPGC